jgi:hypothetical protein
MMRQATKSRTKTTMMKAVRRTISRTAAMNPWKKIDSQPPPVPGISPSEDDGGTTTATSAPRVGLGVMVGVSVGVGVGVKVGVGVGVSVGVGVGVSVGVGVGVGVSVGVGLGIKVAVGGTAVGGTRVGARVAVGRGH